MLKKCVPLFMGFIFLSGCAGVDTASLLNVPAASSRSANTNNVYTTPSTRQGAYSEKNANLAVTFEITNIDNRVELWVDGRKYVNARMNPQAGFPASETTSILLSPGSHRCRFIIFNAQNYTPAGGLLTIKVRGQSVKTIGFPQGGSYPAGKVFDQIFDLQLQ